MTISNKIFMIIYTIWKLKIKKLDDREIRDSKEVEQNIDSKSR